MWWRVSLWRGRRRLDARHVHRAEPRPLTVEPVDLRCVRLHLLSPLARPRTRGQGGQEVGRQLPQLLAPARRGQLHECEQGREASDPLLPPTTARGRVGVCHRRQRAEAPAAVDASQPCRLSQGSGPLRGDAGHAADDRGLDARRPHVRIAHRRGDEGGDHLGPVRIRGVAAMPRGDRWLRGDVVGQARLDVVRSGPVARPARRDRRGRKERA